MGAGLATADAGFGVGMDVVVEERLKGEAMLAVEGAIGDETFVSGGTVGGGSGDIGDADAKPENSSAAKRSFESAGVAGFAVSNDG
jgi:hypothetical protein